MSYEINEVVIIDSGRNIVNAGIITASRAELATLEVNGASIGDILDEDNLGSDSASAVPTQQSVKAYVDATASTLQADIDANETASDNAEAALSGRIATLEADPTTQTLLDAEALARANADNALDVRVLSLEADPTTQTLLTAEATARASADASETSARFSADNALSARLDTLELDPTTATAVAAVQTDVDNNEAAQALVNADFATLSGVALGATTLGTFTGSTISDNSDLKEALQDLENGVDNALGGGAAASSLETVSTSTDAAYYLTFVNDDNVTGTQESFFTDAGIQYNPSSNILTAGEIVVTGNLTVNGSQTIIDTTTIQAQDKNITLGVSSTASDATADGGGFTLQATTDKTFVWLNSTDAFTASEHIDLATGKAYYIDNANVLSKTTLGASVLNSSLTSVGNLTDLTVTGDITANGNITGDNSTDITGIRVMHSEFITINNVNLNASATELNYLDGSTPGTATASNAVVLDGSLDIAGINNIDITGNLVGDGASNISGIASVTASGKMFAQNFTTTSDAALKENVAEIEGAVAKVEAIRGVTFDWKDGSGSTAGVIAQEVEAILPSIVVQGEHKAVDYNGLIGLLVEAVKELSAEVKALKG